MQAQHTFTIKFLRHACFIGFEDPRVVLDHEEIDIPCEVEFDCNAESVCLVRAHNQPYSEGEVKNYSVYFNSGLNDYYGPLLPVWLEIVCRVCATSYSFVLAPEDLEDEAGRVSRKYAPCENGKVFQRAVRRATGEEYFYSCRKKVCRECIIRAARAMSSS
ncbi:movement protein [Sesbania mosaic virus]|uniref:Putative movement protein n=1 Tax=Sesbania mosaic virus TaxID=12558 RepID=Q9EB09_9VIRU|nr:movement protein [Sesbania mosaic virus]AAG01368.1 putative movement protein [Sesbania mosaic virus]